MTELRESLALWNSDDEEDSSESDEEEEKGNESDELPPSSDEEQEPDEDFSVSVDDQLTSKLADRIKLLRHR